MLISKDYSETILLLPNADNEINDNICVPITTVGTLNNFVHD